mgnify:FL=1
MGLLVHLLDVLGVDAVLQEFQSVKMSKAYLDESGELSLESLLVLFLELLHVVTDVAAEDVVLVGLSVELAVGESGESLNEI